MTGPSRVSIQRATRAIAGMARSYTQHGVCRWRRSNCLFGYPARAISLSLLRGRRRMRLLVKTAREADLQGMIADSWMELEMFRLFLLQTAWKIDRYQDYKKVRGDIAAVKVMMPKVLQDVAGRAAQEVNSASQCF